MKDVQQTTCQSSINCTRDPEARTTIHQQETMTQHPHAVADHGRMQHRTATDLGDLTRQISQRHHLGARVVNKRIKIMSGIMDARGDQSRGDSTAWNTVDDQTVETPRTQLAVRAMRGILRHLVSGIPDADPHGTIRGHPACIAMTGTTRDEEQEEHCCEHAAKLYREVTGEPRGRRLRTIAIIHRLRTRREATLRFTTNDARSAGIGGNAFL